MTKKYSLPSIITSSVSSKNKIILKALRHPSYYFFKSIKRTENIDVLIDCKCVWKSNRKALATKVSSVSGSCVGQRQRRCHVSLVPSKRFVKAVVQVAQLLNQMREYILVEMCWPIENKNLYFNIFG